MLAHPRTGRPLIEKSVQLALKRGWNPIVITRPEKISLIDFVKPTCEILEVDETREWPDTLLRSEHLWGESNIVILPDTEFGPPEILDEIDSALRLGKDFVFATFMVENADTWGVVKSENGKTLVCEKPSLFDLKAWGLFGFRKQAGVSLLKALLESTLDHQWKSLPSEAKLLNLDYFSDLSRVLSFKWWSDWDGFLGLLQEV